MALAVVAPASAFLLERSGLAAPGMAAPRPAGGARTAQGVGASDIRRDDGPETQFIITRTENGTECRTMTRTEAEYWRGERGRTDLRILGDSGLNRVAGSEQSGFKIVLRATSQLEDNVPVKEAFLRAAAYWESIITTPITVVLDVDFGTTRFGVPYPNANVIGSTSTQTLGSSTLYSVMRSQLIDLAATPQQERIFSLLPVGSLPTEIGSTTSVFVSSPILRALGFIPPVANPSIETNYGAVPSIGFNSSFPFDFDPTNGIDHNRIDFHSTAVHEIGHLLGFSSYVGQNEIFPGSFQATSWDFYRFRPGVTLDSFTTAPRLLVSGNDHSHFAGLGEFALSTSRLDGQGGDGRQAPHWKDDSVNGQVLGIMDPSASNGIREDISALDLETLGHFGYRINPTTIVTERLVIDDNTANSFPVVPGSLVVNRLTPSRYPAKVRSVMVRIPFVPDQLPPMGASLRLVVFQGGSAGNPPPNPQFLFDRVVTVPSIVSSRFVEFTIDGPTIQSGDLFIGLQTQSAAGAIPVGISIDTDGVDARRSFISRDNGASFERLNSQTGGTGTANFMARAVVTYQFDAPPVPVVTQVSPNLLPVGGVGQVLVVSGSGFEPDSVARFRGTDRETKYLTSALLEVTLTSADLASAGTADLTVQRPGSSGPSSSPVTLTIGAESPAPTLTRLDPPSGPQGAASLLVNVYGSNLTALSRIRVNGAERATTFISSVQLATTLQAGDLGQSLPISITVVNPAPGGGTSNSLNLGLAACSYSLSTTTLRVVPSGGATDGVTVQANNQVCSWQAASNTPWISILRPASSSGTGKLVVNYAVQPNTSPQPRQGTLTIAGRTVEVRQAGLLAAVSAASYLPKLAADSIVAGYGAGLARAARLVTTLPLPTNADGTVIEVRDSRGVARLAPIFYVSPQQVNFLIPSGTAAVAATVTLALDGTTVSTGSIMVTTVAPSLFSANSSGSDVAAAYLIRVRNGVQTAEEVISFSSTAQRFVPLPIDLGPQTDQLILVLFGTGIRGANSLAAVTVRLGDLDLRPGFAGAHPTFAGLDQVNVEIPRSLSGRGLVGVSLVIDGQVSNQLNVQIK